MKKVPPTEQWKKVKFNFAFTNEYTLEVSNIGRLRTFNQASNGNILKGSMTDGYRIIRLRFYKPREEKLQAKLNRDQKKVYKLARVYKFHVWNLEKKAIIEDARILYINEKEKLSKKFKDDLKVRTINYHALVHRLVASAFLKAPKKAETIVAHLDHNKLNNEASNLKWMTPDENYAHQKRSPYVIKEKKERKLRADLPNAKLNIAKVKELKKLLNEGISVQQLVKKFNITDVQVYRIKRGENWGEVKAGA